ncbi:MAG: pseudouridine synthase [Prevotella sp.]|nr:pseudouridine synthase [Candidatus Equicola faecalis]
MDNEEKKMTGQQEEMRPRRPRVVRAERVSYGNNQQTQRTYRPRVENDYDNDRRQTEYRPRRQYGYGNEDGYQPQGNRQPREGYQPRGDYHSREGYQPRRQYNYNDESRGEYTPRNSYGRPQGGYQSRGGYGQNRGRYQNNRPSRGYQPRGEYNPNNKYSFKKRIEYKEINTDPDAELRLNKFLANAGVCSRREADQFIQAGVVSVNGQIVTELGTKVKRSDEVRFHDQPVNMEKKLYVLLNKPKDYVTTVDDPQQRKTVMELVSNAGKERIYPVGRLDRNTTGVLLLTNDGELASKLTHPRFLKKKVYMAKLDKNITKHDMEQLIMGIQLEDGEIHADQIEYAKPDAKDVVGIEIHSGRNRIVRRMFEAVGYKVLRLDRTMFAGLTKKNLRRGDWRYLTEQEVDMLRAGAYE